MDPLAYAETYCSFAPSQEQWLARREMFTSLGHKLYNGPGLDKLPEKFRALERELERCYCSGAYLGCVIFAKALVEMFFMAAGEKGRQVLEKERLAYVDEELKWLTKRRNDLLHFLRAPDAINRSGYTEQRSDLDYDARKAAGLVYHVARAYVRL